MAAKLQSADDLNEAFRRRGPWVTRFWVDGKAFGGTQYDPSQDARFDLFKSFAGSRGGKRILELGPLEGGMTLRLAQEGASVVAIEGREGNYERCLFIKETLGLDAVEFVLGDVRALDVGSLGHFDAVFNVGVLYHLDEPWNVLRALRGLSSKMFVWTHCAPEKMARHTIKVQGKKLRGMWYEEGRADDPLSGLQNRSFWPSRGSLDEMLALAGWTDIRWLQYAPDSDPGPSGCLWVSA